MTYNDDRTKLEQLARGLSSDITIVYVAREQLSQLNSLYTQNVSRYAARTSSRCSSVVL